MNTLSIIKFGCLQNILYSNVILTSISFVAAPLQLKVDLLEHSHWIFVFLSFFLVHMYPSSKILMPPLLFLMISKVVLAVNDR